MKSETVELLRAIPAMTDFLASDRIVELCRTQGAGIVKSVARLYFDRLRHDIASGKLTALPDEMSREQAVISAVIRQTSPRGRRAVNVTGVLLHTGLGRAPFADSVLEHLDMFSGYTVLQADVETGERTVREAAAEALIKALTGCEAAVVVNNNAAATMLVLNALAKGKETVISRGQLVEIGGAFRIPDVMAQSGTILREVGTTNKTHIQDYRSAYSDETGAFLHVHTSNYRIRGFSSMPDIAEICKLRDQLDSRIVVMDDLGSGALIPLSRFGLPDEPLVQSSIAAGADVCCFSGDKLICGPQCGIICGKKVMIDRIRKNPYMRMFRVCKMTLAALEATLLHFVNDTWQDALPLYMMLSAPMERLGADADFIMESIADLTDAAGYTVSIVPDISCIGSGSIPDEGVPTLVLKLTPSESATLSVHAFAKALRCGMPSVFPRIADGDLIFDMRTLLPGDCEPLITAIRAVLYQ